MIEITFCLGIFENVSLQSCKYFVDEFEAGSKLIGRWRRIVQNCFLLLDHSHSALRIRHILTLYEAHPVHTGEQKIHAMVITMLLTLESWEIKHILSSVMKIKNRIDAKWSHISIFHSKFLQRTQFHHFHWILKSPRKCSIIPGKIWWLTLWRLQRQRNQWKCSLIDSQSPFQNSFLSKTIAHLIGVRVLTFKNSFLNQIPAHSFVGPATKLAL